MYTENQLSTKSQSELREMLDGFGVPHVKLRYKVDLVDAVVTAQFKAETYQPQKGTPVTDPVSTVLKADRKQRRVPVKAAPAAPEPVAAAPVPAPVLEPVPEPVDAAPATPAAPAAPAAPANGIAPDAPRQPGEGFGEFMKRRREAKKAAGGSATPAAKPAKEPKAPKPPKAAKEPGEGGRERGGDRGGVGLPAEQRIAVGPNTRTGIIADIQAVVKKLHDGLGEAPTTEQVIDQCMADFADKFKSGKSERARTEPRKFLAEYVSGWNVNRGFLAKA